MGVEQAIFTACESGITRNGAGLQIYSYSSGMEAILDTTDASILFQYEAPHERRMPYEGGKSENEPRKYAYAIVEEKRPLVGFASNHAVKEPREGSYFSHVLVTNLLNVTRYPCEYYESPLFLEGLSDMQRSARNKPDYLYKATRLKEGQAVTYESVREFLLSNNRISKFKKLCAALLSGKKEEGQKRIILIDENAGEKNHIIFWIAAMTMVLPRTIARKVSFSDYEYEPLSAPYRICGTVQKGVRLPKREAEENAYVFDFIRDQIPLLHTDAELLDVFELCIRVSKDCMEPFYEFLGRYRYEACDERLYDAYELYKLLTVRDYMTKMTRNRLHQALAFAEDYAKEEERQRFTEWLLAFLKDSRTVEGRILKEVIWYLRLQQEKGKVAKEKIYLPLLSILYETFKTATKEAQQYRSILKEAVYFFEQTGTSLYSYYLGYLPEQQVQLLLRKTADHWKIGEVLSIIKEYLAAAKPTISQVAVDQKLNLLLKAILTRTRSICPAGKGLELEQMWNAFSFAPNYATYFYLFTEHITGEKEMEEQQYLLIRGWYSQYFWSLEEEERKEATDYLLLESEQALIVLFHYQYERRESYKSWFLQVVGFIEQYGIYGGNLLDAFMQECFENAVSVKTERYEAVLELFQYTFKIGYRDRFINRLVPYLSAGIPLVVSKTEQISLIKKLYYYQVNFNGGMIEKRVAVSYRLFELTEFLESNPKKREKIFFAKRVALPTMNGAETNNYIKRAATCIGEIIFKNGQVSLIHDCYQLSDDKEQLFLTYVYEALLKKGRKKKEYMMFLHTFVYTLEEERSDLISTAIESSGAKIEDLTDQLTKNMNHLMAYKKLLDKGGNKGEKIPRYWMKVIKRVLKPE